ncbi:MAG: helix-turn-helix transcriptional regulator [Syntrophaceae bacterium]|nr:helix-turn-helix transcriptional regulator [Syntrophaceae bacterium]
MSADRIGHIVKSETGKPPIDYLIGRRIGESQKLLLSTILFVSKIAEMVRYQNVSHFTNAFRKKLGITPAKFRKKYNISSIQSNRKQGFDSF